MVGRLYISSTEWLAGGVTTLKEPGRLRALWRRAPRWVRTWVRAGLAVSVAVTALAAAPFGWVQAHASDHLYDTSDLRDGAGPHADVVIVPAPRSPRAGPGPCRSCSTGSTPPQHCWLRGTRPSPSCPATRVAARQRADRDARLPGERGVDPARVVEDPFGLDTYDSCARARQVFGVTLV